MRKLIFVFAFLFASLFLLKSPSVQAVTLEEAFPHVVYCDPFDYGVSGEDSVSRDRFSELNTKLKTIYDNKYPYVLVLDTNEYVSTSGVRHSVKSIVLSYNTNPSSVLYEALYYPNMNYYGCKGIYSDNTNTVVSYCLRVDKTPDTFSVQSITPYSTLTKSSTKVGLPFRGSHTEYISFFYEASLLSYANPNGLFQPENEVLSEDPENFIWNDEGIRIGTPKDNAVMTGYLEDSKSKNVYFDVSVYGKYYYKPGLLHFDKSTEMDILANMFVSIDGVDIPVADSVWGDDGADPNNGSLYSYADPTFTWITPPSEKTGLVKFKVDLRVFSRKFSNKDIQVNTSVKTDFGWTLLLDSNKNITLNQDTLDVMQNGYKGPVDGQSVSGASGDNSTAVTDPTAPSTVVNDDGEPVKPGDDASIIDWIKYYFKYIFYLITLPFKAIANMITALTTFMTDTLKGLGNVFTLLSSSFSFIPEVVRNALWSVVMISLIVFVLSNIRR